MAVTRTANSRSRVVYHQPELLTIIGLQNLSAKRKSKAVEFSVQKLSCKFATHNSLFTCEELNFWYIHFSQNSYKVVLPDKLRFFFPSRSVGLEKQKLMVDCPFIWKEFPYYIVIEKFWVGCVFENCSDCFGIFDTTYFTFFAQEIKL